MKKVTCLTASLASGGAEHQMLILATRLLQKGYDVTLVTCFDYPVCFEIPKNLRVVNLNIHGNRIQKEWYIIKYFISHKTDCIISYREMINFMVLVPMLFRKGIKVIVGERNLTIGKPTFYGWMDLNLLYRRADYIVTNSHSQEQYIRNYTSRYNKKLSTIINYTDLNDYSFSYHEESDIIKIGVFCRYAEQKNYVRFAHAISKVKKESMKSFEVHWYGAMNDITGPRRDYIIFKNLVEKLQIGDVLHLHDVTRNVSQKLSELDAICLPSIYEGFSNALSEGICSGKVALAGDISDNKLMVKNGVNGFLFDPYSINDIAEKLFEFISLSPDERLKMSYQSRSIAEELFSAERFVNSYIKLIDSGKN